MNSRRKFIKNTAVTICLSPFVTKLSFGAITDQSFSENTISEFSKKIKPIGRILELEGYYVWCNTPVYDKEGKVHVFFSRWQEKYGMSGWISKCEIAHAVADTPESEYSIIDTVLSPREGYFDATTCHNPHIKYFNGKYYLFYMGNSNGKTNTKRIGLAIADSLNGPWKRSDVPLLETGEYGSWDDHCTTNPSVIHHPNGQFWLYYKSWNDAEYNNAPKGTIRGNRKYGLAIAEKIEGPYIKYKGNPVIDFSSDGQNKQLEDAFVWYENKIFKLIARDMGFFNHSVGLYFESKDGINWNAPKIAYYGLDHYITQPPAPSNLKRYGRVERPQLLLNGNTPEYLYAASQGGKFKTSSGFLFKLD